jgi:undecaprenyl-diphosphatase
MPVLEFILDLDTQLFYFINVTLQNVVFDWLMPFITDKKHWFPVWGMVIVLLIWKGGKEGRMILVFIIPLIFLSDQLSSSILKPFFGRIRPCIALDNINLLVGRSKAFSFPSSHAVNFFALATYFGFYFRKYIWWFMLVAVLVASSRVFVGVHYPFDVTAGAIIGAGCAFVIIYMRKYFESLYQKYISK